MINNVSDAVKMHHTQENRPAEEPAAGIKPSDTEVSLITS